MYIHEHLKRGFLKMIIFSPINGKFSRFKYIMKLYNFVVIVSFYQIILAEKTLLSVSFDFVSFYKSASIFLYFEKACLFYI